MTLRVGILGGTFDPVHNAHLAMARLALDEARVAKVLWMPTGAPGYRAAPVAPAQDRLAMLKLAIAGEPRYEIDGRELLPGASGFTFDSVAALTSEHAQTRFVLILGADQYAKRAAWHRWPEIEELCDVVVVARPGWNIDAKANTIPMNPLPISASDIRARVARGEDISAMVPAAVAAYIREKGLYR